VLLGGGTAAWAFWSATGSGTASVSTTSAAQLTVTAGATPPALFPGRTVDLPVSVANPNGYPVSLTRLTGVTVTSSNSTACPATNITLPSAVTSGIAAGGFLLPTPINANAGSSGSGTLSGLITLASSAPDGCQSRTFDIALTFSGAQV
jgi:hypothetical protein